MLLQTQNVTRRFGGVDLFSGVTFEIKDNARIGLVGRNGAGKSTLLEIIAGIEEPDDGRVMRKKDLTTGFLTQHVSIESNRTIWEEMREIFKPVLAIENQLRELEIKMGEVDYANTSDSQDLLTTYNTLQEEFESKNGYGYKSEIKMVLHGFKFYEDDYDMPIAHLSGGQKTRLSLAKLLLEKRDLLILDEPTNHLDIDTLSWLESYLASYRGALVIVSHDRYFLDKLTTETYELSYGKLYHYKGNYTAYLKAKAERLEKQTRDYEKQQKEIADMEDFIARNLARASTTGRAQSRRKQLQKIDRIDKPLEDGRSAFFAFEPERQSGNVILQTKNLTIGYEEAKPLSRGINIDIRKGTRMALIGPNGAGKSTLLKTLIERIPALNGEIDYGTKVDIGYYDQEQYDLNPSHTVLKEAWDEQPLMNEETIRTFLGSFLFSGDDVAKSISSLSGGERARVSLAKLALNHNNFLILDEPTNHLDIDSKEVLENALIDFTGTILFVSHDRYFINRMADQVLEIHPDGTTLFLGDYDYYLHKKEEKFHQDQALQEKESVKSSQTVEADNNKIENANWSDRKEIKREVRRIKREIETIESEIATLEMESEEFTKQMNELSSRNMASGADFSVEDSKQLSELSQKYEEHTKRLDELYEEWEVLHTELLEYPESEI